jgi:hypothetical protein
MEWHRPIEHRTSKKNSILFPSKIIKKLSEQENKKSSQRKRTKKSRKLLIIIHKEFNKNYFYVE